MKITLSEKQVMKILADLEFLVTSLDHIGSADLSDEDHRAELEDFIKEGNVFKRLAKIRKLLWKHIDKTVSHAEVLALEEELEPIKKWKIKR